MPENTPTYSIKSMEEALILIGQKIVDFNWTVYNSYAEQLKERKE